MRALEKLSADRQAVVRREVRELLDETHAFADLPGATREQVTARLADVVAFLADPDAGRTPEQARARPTAQPSARPTAQPSARPTNRPTRAEVREDFAAAGPRAGVRAYAELVDAVDFPEFVAGLVSGVFQAIVDATIEQMQAYVDLLEDVSKSVDEFLADQEEDSDDDDDDDDDRRERARQRQRQRQQKLATTVLMGINRIVVTRADS